MSNVKFYSAKSKAIRALTDTFGVSDKEKQNAILEQGSDGRWGFDPEKAKQIKNDSNYVQPEEINAAPAPAPAPVAGPKTVVVGAVSFAPDGALEISVKPLTAPIPSPAPATIKQVSEAAANKKPSAKKHIRELMATGEEYTMEQMMVGGYTVANIKTALSDLKNPIYSDGAPLIVKRTRKGDTDFYQVDASAMMSK